MSSETLNADEMIAQSLSRGAAGVALLHIERALSGTEDWQNVHAHLRQATSGRIVAAEHAGLYYGAPALAFVLHAASGDGKRRYRSTAARLDGFVLRIACLRLAAATARMDRGEPATFQEYDLFSGLIGIAALLLRRMPESDVLARVLQHLVRLTHSRVEDGMELPGWWVPHDPDPILPTPDGHANLGMAHGAAGLLAVLSLAARHGCVVRGQREAIGFLLSWFSRWRQISADGPWWPQWLTREDLRCGQVTQPGPGRPSWCYGAPGITRALQLAAIALGDRARHRAVEKDLAACLNAGQLRQLSDVGLCHGLAGVYQTAYRASQDALSGEIAARLPELASLLIEQAASSCGAGAGLLTGEAGVRLAMAATHTPPRSGWDSCLLIT
ncbi:lanthionine synthetase C family protein [Nonomuraea sp. LP-02]|uniref:lanthionine synthetase C family protein n=1 Tax=Nonomuraea sp. LP-02 TaxID=3097960 RepID=UPI002E3617F0|nr:lanthionine synthetase C family protein [Nonomuraea sp. LP-02]MED7928834.1 lanthionine synthetase C family protein [Nonomuraea sp. LP-02]